VIDAKAPYNLSCLVFQDQQTKMYVGHCLNYDLMDSGPSPEVAWQRLKNVLKNHIEYCYTSHKEGLRRAAKQKSWDEFFTLVKNNPGQLKVEKLDLELREPSLPEQDLELWVIGQVQDAGFSPSADVQAGQGKACVN
jgi:hypothetical protein